MSDSLPASMKAMEAEAQELRVLVKAQEDEKSELNNEIQTLKERVDQLESDKETVMRTLVAQMRAIEQSAMVDTASERQKMAEESVTLAKQRWLNEMAKSLALEQVKEQKAHLEDLMKIMQKRTEELDQLQRRVEEENQAKEEQIGANVKEIESLEEKKQGLDNIVQELEADLINLREEYAELQMSNTDISTELSLHKTEKETIEQEIQRMTADKDVYQKELEDYRLKKHLLDRDTKNLQMAYIKYDERMKKADKDQMAHKISQEYFELSKRKFEVEQEAHSVKMEKLSIDLSTLEQEKKNMAKQDEEMQNKIEAFSQEKILLQEEREELNFERVKIEEEWKVIKQIKENIQKEKVKVDEAIAWLVEQKKKQEEIVEVMDNPLAYSVPSACLEDKQLNSLMTQFLDMVEVRKTDTGASEGASNFEATVLLPCLVKSASSSVIRIAQDALAKAQVKANKHTVLLLFHCVTKHMSSTVCLDRRCASLREAGLHRKFQVVANVMYWMDDVYKCEVNHCAIEDVKAALSDP